MTSFFWPPSCLCGHLRNPSHSLQPVISISHPKRPDQRIEREAQIAEIAGRPQRRVFVDADDAVKQQRRFAASLHPSGSVTLIEGVGCDIEAITQLGNRRVDKAMAMARSAINQ
jgi:hypothetical protein